MRIRKNIAIKNIAVDVEYRSVYDVAVIESARLDAERVRPGGYVKVQVTYRPFLEDPVVRTYPVTVPADAEEGYAIVFVGDADAYETWERSRAPDRYSVSDARRMLELLSRGGTQQQLRVSLVTTKMGIAVQGAELPNLPLSVLSVMSPQIQNGEGQPTRGSILAEATFPTPFVLQGSTLLPLFIDRNAPSQIR